MTVEEQAAPEAADIRPVVAGPVSNRGLWLFGAVLLAAGGGLFYALQMNRLEQDSSSALAPQAGTTAMISSPPPLVIPPDPGLATYGMPAPPWSADPGAPYGGYYPPDGDARTYPSPRAAPQPARSSDPAPVYPVYAPPAGPAFAYQAPMPQSSALPAIGAAKDPRGRAEARRLLNPGTTVPQGSVIQAVMETALDSTRAGFARALVSRDVMSFDGRRVLIPKGSKLFGEYQSDVSLGQKRALIQWHRLTRPDGSIIDIDSPSADPLGRAGVKGKVNTHFFERFSGAILQSALDVGVRAATREAAGDTVIVGLPGSTTQAATIQNPSDIKPTLKIAPGASVSVFVARDLDFTPVEP